MFYTVTVNEVVKVLGFTFLSVKVTYISYDPILFGVGIIVKTLSENFMKVDAKFNFTEIVNASPSGSIISGRT